MHALVINWLGERIMTSLKPKKSKWVPGMIYAVPLADGSFGMAQAIDAMTVNIIYVAIFIDRTCDIPPTPPKLTRTHAVSLVATWRQHLNSGDWPSIGVGPLVYQKKDFPNEQFAKKGYIGAKHYDIGILQDFLSAYHGIVPWNVNYKEDYYDQFLMLGKERPSNIIWLSPEQRLEYRRNNFGTDT